MLATVDPEATAPGQEIRIALESNHIVYFPRAPLPLPDAETLDCLRRELPPRLRLKNISYHPEGARITGLEAGDDLRERTRAVLVRHLEAVAGCLYRLMPRWQGACRIGTCSFRPIEERGRNLKPHASNELVHIDAGAYGATDGSRIFRFFVNVNEREDRVWASKGTFREVLERHGAAAGLLDGAGNLRVRIDKGPIDRAFSSGVRALARLNPLAHTLDSSPYDRAMRRLHNYMKDSEAFKSDLHAYEEIHFPPYSAWMVFTDGVSHASLAGQFALVTTLIVPRSCLERPEYSPYAQLAARSRRSSSAH
jgi:hypothetical protein